MREKTTYPEKCILVLLILLSAAAAALKIIVGFDIDEGYAIAMPQRLVAGEHLFRDLWEVHQTSAFLPAGFMAIFEKITSGTEGIAIYLRIIATVIHFAMSVLVYRACSKLSVRWRVLLALLYYNFLPKWIISLDFSMQQIWGMTLTLYFLHRALTAKKRLHAFLTGISLAFTVLAYPGMVLLYPVLLVSAWKVETAATDEAKSGAKESGKAAWLRFCGFMTLACALCAAVFFAVVLSAMSVRAFLQAIPLVFMDGTHQFTMAMKFSAYAGQWRSVAKQICIFAAPSILITFVIKKTLPEQTKEISYGALLALVWTTITSALVLLANVIGLAIGPFHFQVRYLGFCAICFVLICRHRSEQRELLWEPFVCSLAAFVGILLFSNVGPDSSSSYLILAVIGSFILLHELTIKNNTLNLFVWAVCALFVLSLIFCKGYYVRITEYGPSNILQPRVQMTEGPLKGLYLLPEDQKRAAEDRMIVQAAASQEEKLLFLGTEGILNLSAKGAFVSPSTISTPAFNEQWTLYFTMYPEKQPDVIVIAKNTIDDREKFFAKNPFGMWIAQNYDTMHKEETDSLCVIRRGGAGR